MTPALIATTTRPNGPQLLRWAIDRSGLTIRKYATRMFRSERTVSRWLDGETGIPRQILQYLLTEWEAAGRPPLEIQ